MSSVTAYDRWARGYAGLSPNVCQFLRALPHIAISERKALLSMTRTQQFPAHGTRTYERLRDAWQVNVTIPMDDCKYASRSESLQKLAMSISDYPLTPVFAGFLSSHIRSAPYADYGPVQRVKTQSIHKELAAAITISTKPKPNFAPILGQDADRSLPVFEGLMGNREVAEALYTSFQSSAKALQGKTLFPKISKKTVGSDTIEQIEGYLRWVPWDEFYETEYSVQLLERIYHVTGYKVGGAVELRSAWKYNDLKPRIYFAQGGAVYPSTKYVQAIFNEILEHFPVVHPVNRFAPPEDVLAADELLIIYDYSSFTSSLDNIVGFIESLAEFYEGVSVTLVDSHTGLVEGNVGEILRTYNAEANYYSTFQVDELLQLDDVTFQRHTCGMLGVPGNISSCTLLHGIFVCFLTGSTRKGRCVGDDARVHVKTDAVANTIEELSSFGELSGDKVETWESWSWDHDAGWHYIKRPINRLGPSMVTSGDLLIFPTLDTVLGLRDDFHRCIPQKETLPARRSRFSAQWMRVLRRLWVMSTAITDTDRTILDWFQKRSIRVMGLEGKLGYATLDGVTTFIPLKMQPEEFGMDPYKIAIEQYALEEIVLAPDYDNRQERPYGHEGEVFVSSASKILSLLEALGYLEKSLRFGEFSRSTCGDTFFRTILEGMYPETYDIRVLRDLPDWSGYLFRSNLV